MYLGKKPCMFRNDSIKPQRAYLSEIILKLSLFERGLIAGRAYLKFP